jgi:hypothetical protein
MATAEDRFRHYARECVRWADECRNDEQRQLFLDMARTCRQLALAKDGRTEDGKHPLSYIRPAK